MADHQGPTVRDMIQTHTLALEIMSRHDAGANAVLDSSELALLRQFVTNPAAASDPNVRGAILAEHGMSDAGDVSQRPRSLVGYAIATHGGERAALTDGEIQELREWFERGGGM